MGLEPEPIRGAGITGFDVETVEFIQWSRSGRHPSEPDFAHWISPLTWHRILVARREITRQWHLFVGVPEGSEYWGSSSNHIRVEGVEPIPAGKSTSGSLQHLPRAVAITKPVWWVGAATIEPDSGYESFRRAAYLAASIDNSMSGYKHLLKGNNDGITHRTQ